MRRRKTVAEGGSKQEFLRPEGQIRQSQVVTTFGPGALVDLVDQAVLIGGLDFWHLPPRSRSISHPRLRDALLERFQGSGIELHPDKPFLEPPVGEDQEPSYASGLEALELPQWFVCQNPACRALVRSDGLELKSGRYRHFCERNRRSDCVPVRFVGACTRGHVCDFPWIYFCHRERGTCPAPQLELHEGATGDFSELIVRCVCGAWSPLSDALATEANPPCTGERPWLGSEGGEACDEKLRLLVRTASNVYFPQVVSALSIPDPGGELRAAIDEVWDVLKAATAENIATFRQIPKVSAAIRGYSDDEVLAVVRARLEGGAGAGAAERLRTAEFRQLVTQPEEQPGDLPAASDDFFARQARFASPLPEGVAGVTLAMKLREVRVQIGFTRIEPVIADLQGEFDLGVESQRLGLTTRWLPAAEVWGEGLLLRLDEEAVQQWERREAVQRREKELREGYETHVQHLSDPADFPGIRFYLLHSLSHLLLVAISMECGYAASSIRERIYSAAADDDVPMAAILLSTGTPGTDGTLGGLVEQGRAIRRHLQRAWELASLCSNDPVCARHSPARDYEERHLEGAACHGCLFVAECSCERFNRYLDRALVAPTLGNPVELAFFRERP